MPSRSSFIAPCGDLIDAETELPAVDAEAGAEANAEADAQNEVEVEEKAEAEAGAEADAAPDAAATALAAAAAAEAELPLACNKWLLKEEAAAEAMLLGTSKSRASFAGEKLLLKDVAAVILPFKPEWLLDEEEEEEEGLAVFLGTARSALKAAAEVARLVACNALLACAKLLMLLLAVEPAGENALLGDEFKLMVVEWNGFVNAGAVNPSFTCDELLLLEDEAAAG